MDVRDGSLWVFGLAIPHIEAAQCTIVAARTKSFHTANALSVV